MSALAAGVRAPGFVLPTVDGSEVSLPDLLKKGPVLLAFFKVSCPVCQYAFPYFERMYKANRGSGVTFLGISQDNARDSMTFIKQFGITFPVALDDPAHYTVSNAYGLTNVPTLFFVDSTGEIRTSSVSWSKIEVEEINAAIAETQRRPAPMLWQKGEDVRDFRAG